MNREEAIKELKEYEDGLDLEHATPFDKAILYAIQSLSQEPITTTNNDEPITVIYPTTVCDDAISRDMALEKMADYVASGYADSAEDFEEYSRIICQLPPVTQKAGKWIDIPFSHYYKCSECDKYQISATNYCPNCGAKMVEPQERSE